jgi:PilX N-terminal
MKTAIQIRSVPATSQAGIVLPVVLVFLVVIGLLGLSSMQMTRLQLRMSTNDEVRANAFQISQSLSDAIVATPSMTPLIGGAGFTLCTPGQPGCNLESISMPDPALAPEVTAGNLQGVAVLVAPGDMPPWRGSGYSADKFTASQFAVTTTYDRSDEGLGRATITQGLMIFSPIL